MIIHKIKLENFKSYKNSEIELNPGISIIIGENGAGKSTILEAISYALFKEFDGKLEDVKRKTSDVGDNIKVMSVTVEFEHQGNIYQVIRGKKKTSNISKLNIKRNNYWELKIEGDKNVTRELEYILNIDSKSFLNAVYIKQGQMTELIDKTASDRKDFISKLLNIESLEKAWKDMKEVIRVYEDRENNIQGQLKDKNEVIEKIDDLKEKINKGTNSLNEYKNKKTLIEEEYSKIEKEIKENQEKQNQHTLLNTQLITEQNNRDNSKNILNQLNDELNNIYNAEIEINKLKKVIKPLNQLKELKDYKTTYDSKKEQLSKINEEYTRNKNTQEQINKNKEDYDNYLIRKSQQEKLEEQKRIIEKEKEKYNKLEAEFKQKSNRKDYLGQQIHDTANNVGTLLNFHPRDAEDIQNVLTEHTNKNNDEIDIITKKINQNETEIKLNRNKMNETKKSLNDLKNTTDICPICQSNITHQKHEELESNYEEIIVNCKTNIDKLEKSNEEFKKQLNSLNDFKSKLEKFNIPLLKQQSDEFEKLLGELKDTDEIYTKINENKEHKNKIEEDIKNNKELMLELEENYQKYITANELIKEFNSIENIQTKQETLRNEIESLALKIKSISQQVQIRDNLDLTIKYLEQSKEKCDQLKGKVENKEIKLKQKEDLNNKMIMEENNIHDIEVKIAELSFNEENYNKLNDNCISLKEKLDTINNKIIELETTIKQYEINLNENIKKINELKDIEKNQRKIKEYLKLLNHIRDIYSKDNIQKELRNRVKPQIENNTNKIFQEFDFEYDALKLNEDYEITMKMGVEELPLNLLSGGEKIVIALALRLGIAQVLTQNKTELLILDEPTIHLDNERRSDLIGILHKINIVPQMLVVTHDEEMLSSSNNTIRISKVNGISNIETD